MPAHLVFHEGYTTSLYRVLSRIHLGRPGIAGMSRAWSTAAKSLPSASSITSIPIASNRRRKFPKRHHLVVCPVNLQTVVVDKKQSSCQVRNVPPPYRSSQTCPSCSSPSPRSVSHEGSFAVLAPRAIPVAMDTPRPREPVEASTPGPFASGCPLKHTCEADGSF